ncbi:ATP-binding protein [Olsenella uli]|uniref:AlbA family DNA-binding domain-containing protein n=1 Tax=Olsenella uli TaxID=133926 RepID=UPI001957C95D|nr:ATP-binding protein [Olsenella uli]MBM6676469.1 ATP-binding protein [Olsenella uli]
MFSPFRDADGTPKALAEVAWDDLSQLADLDEGFVLEFKRDYTSSVQRKIPKIIASFANSRGGWLVIGISDEEHAVCPVARRDADFGQIIGELCRRHVSPAPPFDVRFLPDPADEARGVVIVRVDEGGFPPYIADGVVEIREGSTSGPATGAALVELYGKATGRRREIAEFCNRTVFYPATGPDGQPLPLFDLYLYRMARPEGVPSREEVAVHVGAMRAAFAQQGVTCHVSHAHDSLILRTALPAGPRDVHSAIELLPDESMKLTVPAVLLDEGERGRAVTRMRSLGLFSPEEGHLIDARATMRRVSRMASLLDRYVRARRIAWQGYAVAYELENMAGIILWSDSPVYQDYIAEKGVLSCGTTDCRSRVRYLDDGAHDSFRARQFAGSHFFEACGLPLGSPDPQDAALVDALLSTAGEPRRAATNPE